MVYFKSGSFASPGRGLYCPVSMAASTTGREAAGSGLMGGKGMDFFPRVESEKRQIINVAQESFL